MLGAYELTSAEGVNNKHAYTFIEDILSKEDVDWRVLEKVLINKYFTNMLFAGVGIYDYMDTLTCVYSTIDKLHNLKCCSTTDEDFIPSVLSGFTLSSIDCSYYRLTSKMVRSLERDPVFVKLAKYPLGLNISNGVDDNVISINLGAGHTRSSLLLTAESDMYLSIDKNMVFSGMLNDIAESSINTVNLMASARLLRSSLYLYRG